jgi:hypothetical protein
MDDPSPEVVDRLRSICANHPASHEEPAWTGMRWKVRNHTYAHVLVVVDGKPPSHARAIGDDGPATVVTFHAPPAEVEAFASMGHPYFYGGWGRDVVGFVLDDDTDWDEVEELVTDSYRVRAPRTLLKRLDAATGR